MSEDRRTIRVLLTLDGGAQYSADLKRSEQDTRNFGETGAQAGAKATALASAVRGMAGAFGAYGALEVTKAISATGRDFDGIRDRINAVRGSTAAGSAEFANLVSEADRLGVSITGVSREYTDLISASQGTRLEGQGVRDLFGAIGEASARLNLEQTATNATLDAVGDILRNGVVEIGRFNRATEQMPGLLDAAANGMDVSRDRLLEMIRDGKVMADQLLPAITRGLREAFGTDRQAEIEGTGESFSRLRNETKLYADELAGPLNGALATTAQLTAELLKLQRESGLGAFGRTYVGTVMAGTNAALGAAFPGAARTPSFAPFNDPFSEQLASLQGLLNTRPTGPDSTAPLLPDGIGKAEEDAYRRRQQRATESAREENRRRKDQADEARRLLEKQEADAERAAEAEKRRQDDLYLGEERRKEQIDEMILRAQLQAELVGKTDAAEIFAIEKKLGLYDELDASVVNQLELIARQRSENEAAAETEEKRTAALRDRLELEQRLRGEMDREIRDNPMARALGIDSIDELESRLNPLKDALKGASDVAFAAFERVGSSVSEMLSNIILFGDEGDISIRRIAQALVQNLLQGLIQVGIQMGINFALGSAYQAIATATGATAAASLTAAWTPAAYAASVATLGAAPAAGTTAYVSGLGTASAATAATAAAGGALGGREKGGPVAPHSLYPVAERGAELLQYGDDTYLMTGSRGGRVIPAGGASAGGAMNVTIQLISDGTVQVTRTQARQTPDGMLIQMAVSAAQEMMVADAMQGGPVSQAFSSSFNLQRTSKNSRR